MQEETGLYSLEELSAPSKEGMKEGGGWGRRGGGVGLSSLTGPSSLLAMTKCGFASVSQVA